MKTKVFQNIIKNDKKFIETSMRLSGLRKVENDTAIQMERTKLLAEEVEKIIDELVELENNQFINSNELKTKLSEMKL